jgi:hypothetical protein
MKEVRDYLPSFSRVLDVYNCFRSCRARQYARTLHGYNGDGLAYTQRQQTQQNISDARPEKGAHAGTQAFTCADKTPLIHAGLPVESSLIKSPL